MVMIQEWTFSFINYVQYFTAINENYKASFMKNNLVIWDYLNITNFC